MFFQRDAARDRSQIQDLANLTKVNHLVREFVDHDLAKRIQPSSHRPH